MPLSPKIVKKFQKQVLNFYFRNRRAFPWRPPLLPLQADDTLDPYRILVSEVMLQQTQVERVVPYFVSFMERFPTVGALSGASVTEVLSVWQGLGYNRRALNLKRAGEMIDREWRGRFSRDAKTLATLPGVGPYTARAVVAFAWNIPEVLIETNIRAVYLHLFFTKQEKVSDASILPLIFETLPSKVQTFSQSRGESCSIREWYYALMDYGSYLKKTIGNPNVRSKLHTKQKPFHGSRRELRGEILRQVIEKGTITVSEMSLQKSNDHSLEEVFRELEGEGFLRRKGERFSVT